MYADAFPVCTVGGSIYPVVPFGYIYIAGAIPQKCSLCSMHFEGSCRRAMPLLGRLLSLDYGPCRISGESYPTLLENRFITAEVEVPRKCATCKFLHYDELYGFRCAEDAEVWGHLLKTLDWGAFDPDTLYVELPYPKVTTKILTQAARSRDMTSFIKEYRRINPSVSMIEAQEDYLLFLTGLTPNA